MSLERCPTHGPFVADRSTDFGETWCPECGPMPNPSNSDLVGEARRLSAEIAQHIADAAALLPELAQQLEQARAENARLRGWPEIKVGTQSPAHSPVDRYRCENLDCEIESVWEFRPDDYELDESIVNCPACGEEGELFFRWFRGGAALTPDEGADPPEEEEDA